ncbi:PQQ-dependent sugar dehydrogenase [Porticoccaceae bacterium]|nr:PQQ-dependent sugar dehydrogenase [Porticoccaceae bacterium]
MILNNVRIICAALLFSSGFAASNDDSFEIATLADGLDYPWAVTFISDNEMLVTELSGNLRRVSNGILNPTTIAGVPEVLFAGQGGLSEVTLDPSFADNGLLYLSFSAPAVDQPKLNQLNVIQARLEGNRLVDHKTIFKSDPPRKTAAHYGARLAFLDDGTLLITSGDGFNYREQAQALDNHFGKILRLNTDGSIPQDNPFTKNPDALPEIWSYGHRNLQGLVVADDGTVYEHEHGPQGGDELNRVLPGKNYGWPAITYGVDYSGAMISPFTEQPGMEQPIKYWDPSIAPSGMIMYRGDMFPQWQGNLLISALVPGDVRRLEIQGNKIIMEETLFTQFGRLRNVVAAPDGSLILVTDGEDGKLIRVSAKKSAP